MSGGVNLTQNTPSHARANIEDCIAQAFSACKPQQVDRLYLNFLGDRAVLEEVISSYTPIMEVCRLGEAQAMLYAGLQRDHGMVALSGTGSDVFFLYSDEHGQALRQTLAAQYPDLWARCQARRAFMADVLGIPLPDEVLPLSNAPGLVPPFFLAPNTVLTLEV